MPSAESFVEIYLERKSSTPDAILYTDGDEDFWIPRSVIIAAERINNTNDYKVAIPQWFAEKKEMV